MPRETLDLDKVDTIHLDIDGDPACGSSKADVLDENPRITSCGRCTNTNAWQEAIEELGFEVVE